MEFINFPSVSGVEGNYRVISAQGDIPQLLPQTQPEIVPLIEDSWDWEETKYSEIKITDGKQVLFHPRYAYGTAGIRGKKRLTRGIYAYWEVVVVGKLYGTSVMFGIGTENVKTRLEWMFADLLGGDNESFGLNHYSIAQHDGCMVKTSEQPLPSENCVLGIYFDGEAGSLSYYLNDKFLCTPFVNIDTSKVYYPMISSTAQQSAFLVRSQATFYCVPLLKTLASRRIGQLLDGRSVEALPLPPAQRKQIINTRKRTMPTSDDDPTSLERQTQRLINGVLLPTKMRKLLNALDARIHPSIALRHLAQHGVI